jgi:hypothetical protein
VVSAHVAVVPRSAPDYSDREVVMVKYEYMSETCSYVMLVKVLNERGDFGWELIDIDRQQGRVDMIFKRRVERKEA